MQSVVAGGAHHKHYVYMYAASNDSGVSSGHRATTLALVVRHGARR
jgi:hypothetical protein